MRRLVIFLIFACAISAQAATIDTLNYGGYPAGLSDGQYYVGLAQGSLGSDPVLFQMFCVDSSTLVHSGETWEVKVLSLDEAAVSNSRGFTLWELKVMAVLGTMFDNTNPNDSMVQHAIWSLGDDRTLTPDEGATLIMAQTLAATFDFSRVQFLDPTTSRGQVMMRQVAENPVPEPATYGMMGLGLAALGLIPRRKR